VECQQWPNTRNTLFERTRQSSWLDAETTPVNNKRVNSCVWKHPLFWGSLATKKPPKTPRNAFSDALLMSRFKNGAAKKQKLPCARFFETALRTVLIDQLIRGQRFWEIVCFTGVCRVVIDGHRILLGAHVDASDFVITCANRLILDAFWKRLLEAFEGTYEGPLEHHLRCEITRDPVASTTTLSQKHYAEEILRSHGFWDIPPRNTPMRPMVS